MTAADLPRLVDGGGRPPGPVGREQREPGLAGVERAIGVDVAHHHEHGAVGPVVAAVERLEVGDLDPLQVVWPAEDRVAIRMADVAGGEVGLVEPAEGRLLLAGPLLGDHLAFGRDLDGVEGRPEHPVGLDRQRQFPAIGGEGEPVMRRVLARLGVGLARRDEG